MDVLTKKQRSFCMSQIKGKDTKPEIALRKALTALRLRYRLHFKLIGKPDIVFPKSKLAVFIDGCFWHGCPKHCNKPKTNSIFWEEKLSKNRERDLKVSKFLTDDGWTILRFWEHEIKENVEKVAITIGKVKSSMVNNG